MTLLQDNWNLVMYDAVEAVGDAAILYYIAWIVIGAYVLLNLLLVIILDVYVDEAAKIKASAGYNVDLEGDGNGSNGDPLSPADSKAKPEAEGGTDAAANDKSLGIFVSAQYLVTLCAKHPRASCESQSSYDRLHLPCLDCLLYHLSRGWTRHSARRVPRSRQTR